MSCVVCHRAIACLKIANALNPNDREVLVNLGISQVNELSGAKVDPPRFSIPTRTHTTNRVPRVCGVCGVCRVCDCQACLYFAQWLRLSPYSSVLPQDLEKEIAKQGALRSHSCELVCQQV